LVGALQAGRSWVQFPMRSLDFSVDVILPFMFTILITTQYTDFLNNENNFIANCESADL
jgi:hypothetical protein